MLKKTMISVCALSALAFAGESGFFAGVQGGLATSSVSQERYDTATPYFEIESDKNVKDFTYGVKAGYDYYFKENQGIRAYLDYSRADFTGSGAYAKNLSFDLITANIDYRYDFTPEFGGFAGLSLGQSSAKTDGEYGNESGFGFGLNLGLTYQVLSYLELEARLRYFDTDLPEKTFTSGTTHTKVDPDAFTQFLIGVNYKF